MAQSKPPISYDHLSIMPPQAAAEREGRGPGPERAPSGTTLKEVSQAYMVYLHPDADRALKEYALAKSSFRNHVKTHDLVIEAIEDYFRKHGINAPVRAQPRKRGRFDDQPKPEG